jgi:phosphate starvation-inducible PhoH-like protein
VSIPRGIDAVNVLGPSDRYVRAVKEQIDDTLRVNLGRSNEENTIVIFGKEKSVYQAQEVFEKLIEIKDEISTDEVQLLAKQSVDGGIFDNSGSSTTVLKYGKKEIKVRTEGQLEYLNSMRCNAITICIAPPGASKTYTAVCYALSQLINKNVDTIVISRPMVSAKGEADLGALPGTADEKFSLYALPMMDVFERVLGREKLDSYIEKGKIKMLPLGYMRGCSLYKTFLLVDEAENMNTILGKLAVTRLGEDSKIVLCGDLVQQDSKGESGLEYLANSLKDVSGIGVVRMTEADVVRHALITKMLNAFAAYDEK